MFMHTQKIFWNNYTVLHNQKIFWITKTAVKIFQNNYTVLHNQEIFQNMNADKIFRNVFVVVKKFRNIVKISYQGKFGISLCSCTSRKYSGI